MVQLAAVIVLHLPAEATEELIVIFPASGVHAPSVVMSSLLNGSKK